MRLGDLQANERNPRVISAAARARLRASLRRFGLAGSLVWNRRSSRLVGGHQRTEILLDELGPDVQVPVSVVDLGPEDEAALLVGLNREDAAGQWDAAKLDELLQELGRDAPALVDLLDLDGLGPTSAEADRDLADEILSTLEWKPGPDTDERDQLAEALAAAVRTLDPTRLSRAVALVLPLRRRAEPLLVVVDPALADFVAELRRAAEADEPSPLSRFADRLFAEEEPG